MADQLHANTDPIEFDDATADALGSAMRSAASAIDGQVGSRQSYVSTASQEFRGHFSDLFTENASIAKSDGSTISDMMRTVAGWVDEMKTAAAEERERRRKAREWQEQQADRNGFEKWWDDTFGTGNPPDIENKPAPPFGPADVQPKPRQTPSPGAGGGGAGTSSAKPEDLRSFASGSTTLNTELAGRPALLRGKLADFASRCSWGTINADGLVAGFERWLAANDQDVAWATTIADAFAAAGGEGSVSTLSDAALGAALQAAGVSATRSDLQIDPPTAYGAQPTTGYSMDPVNTTTGNFLEPELDLAHDGASASLRFTRMYNSLDRRVGLFGPGWASVLDTRLLLDDEGASFVGADGRLVRFPRAGSGWARGVGENRWLAAEDDLLVVRDNEGGRIDFTPAGLWLGESTGPGTAVHVERDGDDTVLRLRHERGRFVDVEYVDGRVAVLRASDGRRVEYGYDDRGRLLSATTALGTRTYGWDDDDLVVTVTSADGVLEVDNTYDAHRRVVEQISPHGRRVRFAYLPGRVTVVSDHDGTRSNSWIADPKGRLVGVIDSDDRRQTMSYDPHGNLVSATERDGSVTVHAYDGRGRRIRTVTPTGGDLTYGYDDADRVTTVVAESGSVVTYEYDGDERDPAVIIDPMGGRTELHWQHGLLVRAVDPTGVTLDLDHDAAGELVAVTNAVGDTARIERDSAGRAVASISPTGARTEYRHDAAGQVVARRDPDGATWTAEYTVGGRVSAVTDPTGARTALAWGADGELAATTDALGRTTRRTYDDQGNPLQVTLPSGASWTFAHDALSRLQSVVDPTGAVWRREYGVNGDLRAVTDPTGVRREFSDDPATGIATLADAFATTTVRSDEFGRPVEVTSDETGSELVTYDACGRPVELVDGEGGLTRLERDLAGRIVAIVTPSGQRTTYEYDACGRPSAATDAHGNRTTVTYDAESRVIARTLPTGDVERTEYDVVGRVVARTTPGEGTSRWRWDAAGRLVSVHDTRHGRRRFRYDAAGQLVEAENGLGGVTTYTYDADGHLVGATDPLGAVTRYAYDRSGRLTGITDPLGRSTTARYDAAGRRTEQTDPDGRVLRWEYDAAGREEQLSVDGTVIADTTYDSARRAVVVTDHTRGPGRDTEHELCFDRRGLLVRRSRGGRATSWEYDADGLRTARTDPDGRRTTWRWDALGRIVAVERDGLTPAVFTSDALGRIVQASTGDVIQSWSYERGSLVEHTVTTPVGSTTTRVERDEDDRISAIAGADGRVVYGHDAAAQLVSALDVSALDGSGSGRTWQYDAAGRLVAETVDGAEQRHEYDAAGQLLVTTTADGSRTEYVHDGLGRRVRRTARDGSTTEYAWSDLGFLAGVVERDASYSETGRIEVWTDALGEVAEAGGAEVWWDTAAGVPSLTSVGATPVLELPGGVVALDGDWTASGWRGERATDAADPWALLESTVGAAGRADLPAGVGLTPGGSLSIGGMEWLGARVYDPVAKGFLSTDPLAPIVGAGWSGNPYSYAGNDPLHAIDPLGLRPATDKDLQAYRDAHQGAIGTLKSIADDHSDLIAGVAVALGVGLTVATMFTPLGPLALIAGGALLSGGVSAWQQKRNDGKVDWGRVGLAALIGGATGAVGGGVAGVLKQFAPKLEGVIGPQVARVASPLLRKAAVRAIGGQGRAAVATGVQGAFSNALGYVTDPDNGHKNLGGLVQATGAGFATGAVASSVSTVVSPAMGRLSGEALPGARTVVSLLADHAVSGIRAVANQGLKPDDNGGTFAHPLTTFVGGFVSGTRGPRVSMHAAPQG
ncbi:DUF6531 domain-containing protein [Curtobacterium herbarum]|uniref:DUF6531 domain-containing protein n=1 Tax=Curtobacterium herbarum TaxID=150122 RepID=A0ABN1ZD36_9MICO|nr:DUF6531 domain-containing protein [Curtobacterium herbarum]MBM7474194.1 RHS repeat-associated protein [Curtobacterium herbarum]MCS6546017.1 DUF6531 domain-containing protein [Curtobacterium herbarum]